MTTLQLTTLSNPAIAIAEQESIPVENIELTAETGDEMAQCQSALILWCKSKIKETQHQAEELKSAFHHAVKRKWKSDTLKRHAALAAKRVDFYERLLAALEHGYQIVPPFPITAFAVRTNKAKPLKMASYRSSDTHEQKAPELPSGEGEYKNPFPIVHQRLISPEQKATATTQYKAEVKEYFATGWDDLEFPVTMAKPKIMEATTRAMALQIFDEIGILPQDGRRVDPMIIATIIIPHSSGGYSTPRRISFIIAWHLDTETLT